MNLDHKTTLFASAGIALGALMGAGVVYTQTDKAGDLVDAQVADCVRSARFAVDEVINDPAKLEASEPRNSVFDGATDNVLDTLTFQDGFNSPGTQAAFTVITEVKVASDAGDDLQALRKGRLETAIRKSCENQVKKSNTLAKKLEDKPYRASAAKVTSQPADEPSDEPLDVETTGAPTESDHCFEVVINYLIDDAADEIRAGEDRSPQAVIEEFGQSNPAVVDLANDYKQQLAAELSGGTDTSDAINAMEDPLHGSCDKVTK